MLGCSVSSLFLVILYSSQLTTQQTSNLKLLPGGHKHLLLGVFQTCPNKASINRTRLNREAELALRTTQRIFEPTNQEVINDLILRRFFNYLQYKKRGFTISDIQLVTFEVCSPLDLANMSIQIHLSKEFYIQTNSKGEPPTFHGEGIERWEEKSRILAFVVYADQDIVRRSSDYLIDMDFDVHSVLTLDEQLPSHIPSNSEHFILTGDRSTLEARYLLGVFKNLSISFLTMINLQKKQSVSQRMNFESFMREFNTSEECFDYDVIEGGNNVTSVSQMISRLLEKSSKQVGKKTNLVVMLFGNTDEQKAFLNEAISRGLDETTWFLRDANEKDIIHIPLRSNIYTYLYIEYLLPETDQVNRETEIFSVENMNNTRLSKEQLDLVISRTYLSTARILAIYHRVTLLKKTRWTTFRELFKSQTRSSMSKANLFKVDEEKGKHKLFFDPKFDQRNWTVCPKFDCPKGWVQIFGRKNKLFTTWNYSQGYTCRECPKGTYKSNVGDGVCTDCPEFTVSTEDRSQCNDPYIKQYLWFELISVKLFLTANVVCLLTCAFIMIVFFIYRRTPVVVASDYTLSQVHLVSFLLNFASLPFVYLGIPHPLLCSLKPVLISATSGVSLSIIVMKSHKMMQAYKAKVKITKKDRIKSVRMQVFTIIFFILLGQAINYVATVAVGSPEIVKKRHHFYDEEGNVVYHNIIYCNTSAHLHVQIVYFLALQMIALVRAYQGRKLPRVLNDSMSIVYATFTVSVIYATMFPIYFFQNGALNGTKVHWFCLLLSNFCFLVMFYMNKINVILFHPDQNTKVYYRVKMMVNAKNRAHRSISRRHKNSNFLMIPR